MWLPDKIITKVDAVARIYYLSRVDTKRWNEHRASNELRMLTGWCWIARDGSAHGQGLKTQTVTYREAYYALIERAAPPVATSGARLRVVRRAAA